MNWTLGLPFIRTSPDHGTAYDIAGKGKADPFSMLAAMQLAARLAKSARDRVYLTAADKLSADPSNEGCHRTVMEAVQACRMARDMARESPFNVQANAHFAKFAEAARFAPHLTRAVAE